MLISSLYFLFAIAIITYELTRKKRILIDQLSVATIFYLANIVLPAIFIHRIVDGGLVTVDGVTNFPLLGYIYDRVRYIDKWIVLIGAIVAYSGLVFGYKLLTDKEEITLKVKKGITSRLCRMWVIVGLLFVVLMLVFGNSLVPGNPIEGLLLSTYFRAEDPFFAFERTFLNANIYALTHTFLLVSMFGYALSDENQRQRYAYLALTLFFVLIDVIASGARRNLLIAAIFLYMYVVNRSGKYKIYYLLPIMVVSVPLLYFGKAILRNLTDFNVDLIFGSDVSFLQQILVAASEVGISHVESLGTIALYDGLPRLGLDHVFSVLRMLPFGMFGLEEPFPQRIVRISTAYLTGDPMTQDVPPGYIGQCWIDFSYLGFLLIPVLHGIAFALTEKGFKSVDLSKSPFYLMIYLIIGYIVALPFNSGTLDFICSPEIVLTLLIILLLHNINIRKGNVGV